MFPESRDTTPKAGLIDETLSTTRSIVATGKRILRSALGTFLYHTGLLTPLVRRANSLTVDRKTRSPKLRKSAGSKFGILCYHRVGNGGVPYHSELDPSVFEAQIRYLQQHHRIVSLCQLAEEMRSSANVPPTVAITFDDGYRDLYKYAFPVLRRYDAPATVYLIGESVETGAAPWYDRIFAAVVAFPQRRLTIHLEHTEKFALTSHLNRLAAAWQIVCYLRSIPDVQRKAWCREFEAVLPVPESDLQDRMLTWDQVREMQTLGMSFGAHTMSHPSVAQLSAQELKTELLDSKVSLEAGLRCEVEHFAFPFGKPSDRSATSEEYLRQCGFQTAVTTTEGFNTARTNPFRLHRLQIGGAQPMSTFALALARMFYEESPTEDFRSEKNLRRPSMDEPVPARSPF